MPAPHVPTVEDRYAAVATKIIAAARADRGAYTKLAHLTDRIGHRLSGSPGLELAIAWAAQTMKDDGLEVRTEQVMVPHWVRGTERVALVAPVARALHVLGLGGSVSTPKGGITAPIVVVKNFAELEAKATEIKGAIVLYDVAMPAFSPETRAGVRRGGSVPDSRGASRAAKLRRRWRARPLADRAQPALAAYGRDFATTPSSRRSRRRRSPSRMPS